MKHLIWDFDGTLGYRIGMWSGALLEALHQEIPDYEATLEQIQPYLHTAFPWHKPEQPHVGISAEQWWNALEPGFERAFKGIGIEPQRAQSMSKRVRCAFPSPDNWRLFEDTIPTLDRLSSQGWTHILLSNHVPELAEIINHLGLKPHLAEIFNSAETGYEKPHRQAFRDVLEVVDDVESMWMIGDNFTADICGAESVGIPAILVRRFHKNAKYFCEELSQVLQIVD